MGSGAPAGLSWEECSAFRTSSCGVRPPHHDCPEALSHCDSPSPALHPSPTQVYQPLGTTLKLFRENLEGLRRQEEGAQGTSGGLGQGLPVSAEGSAWLQSEGSEGQSSDTGMAATVERLLAGFPSPTCCPQCGAQTGDLQSTGVCASLRSRLPPGCLSAPECFQVVASSLAGHSVPRSAPGLHN